MDLGLCKDQFLMFLSMYYVFCLHEKELVGQRSLFFCKQRVGRLSGFIPSRADLVSASRVLEQGWTRSSGPGLCEVPIERVHLRSSTQGVVCFDSMYLSSWYDEWQLLSPNSYCVCDTNLAGGCPLHVALQVSIFVIIIGYFGQLVKGIMVSLVFPRKGKAWWFP